MNNLSDDILQALNHQQNKIIDSNESKIVVFAGPGSGKTRTLSQKAIKEIKDLPDYKGIIVCSFTVEATNQINNKLIELTNNKIKKSYISTLDSFVYGEIINQFKNRYLNKRKKKLVITPLIPKFPHYKEMASVISKYSKEDLKNNYDVFNKDMHRWEELLHNSEFEFSYGSYVYAIKMIEELDILRMYISTKYTTFYIDEAQDLNYFQHLFIKSLISKCNLKCIMIGDKNQSIYEFRGSKPELFNNLVIGGEYMPYEINVSVRCHESIIKFSNQIVNLTGNDITVSENRVQIINSIDEIDINNLDDCLFLFENNNYAESFYQSFKDLISNLTYTKSLLINSDIEFSRNFLPLIDDIARFYINAKSNNLKNLEQFLEKLESNLAMHINIKKIKRNVILNTGNHIIDYLSLIFKMIDVNIPLNVIQELKTQFENLSVINHYNEQKSTNRSMTIHASKGLEAKNVFVFLDDERLNWDREIDETFRRKLYVAFSRAKYNLYIIINANTATNLKDFIINSHNLIKIRE